MAIYESKYQPIPGDKTETLHGSIKRSISDLTEDGLLSKGGKEEMRADGGYGKPVNVWRLNKEYRKNVGTPINVYIIACSLAFLLIDVISLGAKLSHADAG